MLPSIPSITDTTVLLAFKLLMAVNLICEWYTLYIIHYISTKILKYNRFTWPIKLIIWLTYFVFVSFDWWISNPIQVLYGYICDIAYKFWPARQELVYFKKIKMKKLCNNLYNSTFPTSLYLSCSCLYHIPLSGKKEAMNSAPRKPQTCFLLWMTSQHTLKICIVSTNFLLQ